MPIIRAQRHGANRARCRGTRLLQLQLLAAATAINFKRLINLDPATSQGLTGDPDARNRTILTLADLLIAIAVGEEITFDYAMRNYTIDHFPEICGCGADLCRGSVTGWRHLPDARKADYGELVAPYLRMMDESTAPAADASSSRRG